MLRKLIDFAAGASIILAALAVCVLLAEAVAALEAELRKLCREYANLEAQAGRVA